MGSVVDKVLQVSNVPVWLVRAGVPEEIVYDKWPRRTILVPLDGSKLAESALPHAEAIAKQRGAELVDIVLLSVYQRTPTPPFYPSGVCLETEEECYKRRLEIEQYLARIVERPKGTGVNVRSLVLVGNPADEIIDYATNNRFNIIVMTTHGSSGAGRWTYGSVAEKVLLGTSSPLLLVRPN
jgi:nucleotide-binding universal stress UspA family protein